MKKKDIAPIILVVGISAIFSAILSNVLFNSPKSKQMEVERVNDISSEFTLPDSTIFNENSINPTQIIRIGDGGGNASPFGDQ